MKGNIPAYMTVLSLGVLGALCASACCIGEDKKQTGGDSSIPQVTTQVPYVKATEKITGMNDIYAKLGIKQSDTLRHYKVNILSDTEKIELKPSAKSGKISTPIYACDISFNDNGATEVKCQANERLSNGKPEYLKARKEAFESSIKNCFVNMKKTDTAVNINNNDYYPSACLVSKNSPLKCVITGFGANMAGLTEDVIDGCRIGVKAANIAYGTDLDVSTYEKIIPAKDMF